MPEAPLMFASAKSQAPEIAEFMAKVASKYRQSIIETPGWTISHPTLEDAGKSFQVLVAESKGLGTEPFILPGEAESVIFVEAGGAVFTGERRVDGPAFWKVAIGDSKILTALLHPTKVISMTYRARFDGG
jgi:hypothetical protein